MQILSTITLFALLLMSREVRADDSLDCSDSSNMNQSQMNACASDDFAKADDQLNGIWPKAKKFAADLDGGLEDGQPSSVDTLVKAQKAWLVFRDAQCDLEGYTSRGGSMESMLVDGCKTTMTNERVKSLESLISGE